MTTTPRIRQGADVPLPTQQTNHTPKDIPGQNKPASASPQRNATGADSPDSSTNSNNPLPWTPAHPCYPHPNPHVPRQDPRAKSTRVIRVPRDWSEVGDLYPQFSDFYPEILSPWITDPEFRALIDSINTSSRKAFEPNTARAWLDAALGLITGWLWEDLGFSGGKRGASECERIIADWNAKCRKRRAADRGTPAVPVEKKETPIDVVECVPLRRTAWMSLDFVIPDVIVSMTPEQPVPRGLRHHLTPQASRELIGAARKDPPAGSWVDEKEAAENLPSSHPAAVGRADEDDWIRDVEKGGEVGVAI